MTTTRSSRSRSRTKPATRRPRIRWRPFSRGKANSLWFADVDGNYHLTVESQPRTGGYTYGDTKVRGTAKTLSGAKEKAIGEARKHARRILAAIGDGS